MSQQPEELATAISLNKLEWTHAGLIVGRGPTGSFEAAAVTDPCLSFDTALLRWRLFYTGWDDNGKAKAAQILSRRPDLIGPGEWDTKEAAPIPLTNPEVLAGKSWSQPCPIFEPLRSSYEPALINHKYWLLFLAEDNASSAIYAASTSVLAEAWTVHEPPLYSTSAKGTLATPLANWFPARQEVLVYFSLFAYLCTLSWQPGSEEPPRQGEVFRPAYGSSDWAYGPLQGLQLLPGQEHRWYGLLNSLERPGEPELRVTAGFAFTNEEWPTKGWQFVAEPIERVEAIPLQARAWGEGEQLGRTNMLVLPGGGLRLFYQSGPKGNEQIFLKRARQ